jgi:hypothetical protein
VNYTTLDAGITVDNTDSFLRVANNLSEGTAATMRTNLSLGTMATQAASAVAITGGTASGLTALGLSGSTWLTGNSVNLIKNFSASYNVIAATDGGLAITIGTGAAAGDKSNYYNADSHLHRNFAGTLYSTTDTNGFTLAAAGQGFRIKEGSNARMGTATLVLGVSVVSNTSVTANSRIFLSVESLGTVTVPTVVAVTARTAGTSFTITSSNLTDTSVVAWFIMEPS